MKFVRKLDSRLEGLEDHDFSPHQRDVSSGDGGILRVESIDEGPSQAAPIPEAGHPMPETQPGTLRRIVLDFIEQRG